MPNTEAEYLDREQRTDLTKAINPFGSAPAQASNVAAASNQSREVAEIQAAMLIAQRFPRDQRAAVDRIIDAFSRPLLAEQAQYEYGKGGTDVRGPSIRAAEALAREWGHIHTGVRELEQRPGESTVEAFAWDAQTGSRDVKVFQVPHMRYTRKGSYRIEDPRDIYELVANQGARRKRACILQMIPSDVVEAAMRQADITLHTKAEVTPERLASLLEKFADCGVTKEQIETRIQRRIEAMTPAQMVNLGKIFNSIRDGMSSPADWFEGEGNVVPMQEVKRGVSGLKEAAAKAAPKPAEAETPAANAETNPAEGETKSADAETKAPVYATVAEKIEAADNIEALNLACDLIRSVVNKAHQRELNLLAANKRLDLSDPHDN